MANDRNARDNRTLHGPFHLEHPSAAKSMGGVVDSGNASRCAIPAFTTHIRI